MSKREGLLHNKGPTKGPKPPDDVKVGDTTEEPRVEEGQEAPKAANTQPIARMTEREKARQAIDGLIARAREAFEKRDFVALRDTLNGMIATYEDPTILQRERIRLAPEIRVTLPQQLEALTRQNATGRVEAVHNQLAEAEAILNKEHEDAKIFGAANRVVGLLDRVHKNLTSVGGGGLRIGLTDHFAGDEGDAITWLKECWARHDDARGSLNELRMVYVDYLVRRVEEHLHCADEVLRGERNHRPMARQVGELTYRMRKAQAIRKLFDHEYREPFVSLYGDKAEEMLSLFDSQIMALDDEAPRSA